MTDSQSKPHATRPQLESPLPWIAALPWAARWQNSRLPDDIKQWLTHASEQELMSLIAGATCRLSHLYDQ